MKVLVDVSIKLSTVLDRGFLLTFHQVSQDGNFVLGGGFGGLVMNGGMPEAPEVMMPRSSIEGVIIDKTDGDQREDV